MKTYRISPSVLNAFSNWLEAEDNWEKYWGESETPPMTREEYVIKQGNELTAYLNREPIEETEAQAKGTCLNEIIDCLTGSEPRGDVKWEKSGEIYVAEKGAFKFYFDGALVDSLALMFRTAARQYHLQNRYHFDKYDVELHGYADYIFPTMIYDLKTTGKYEGEKYRDNWQRKVYPLVAVDSGAMTMCERFVFYAMECKADKQGVISAKPWAESYDVNIDAARAEVIEFVTGRVIPILDLWIASGMLPNQTLVREGGDYE